MYILSSTVIFYLLTHTITPINQVDCSQVNKFHVKDDTQEGSSIGRISLSDTGLFDPSSQSKTKLAIVRASEAPASYFSINSITGELFAKRTLDREQLCLDEQLHPKSSPLSPSPASDRHWSDYSIDCQFTFQVAIYQKSSSSSEQVNAESVIPEFVDVLVDLIDVNDHTPSFRANNNAVELQISEAAPIGSRIQLPLASDPDSLQFSVQHYQLLPTNLSEWMLFEQKAETYTHGQVYYRIVGLFLELQSGLDRERQSTHRFEIHAFDTDNASPLRHPNYNKQNILHVSVQITDVNDNGPIFRHQALSNSYNDVSLLLPHRDNLHSSNTPLYHKQIAENTRPNSILLTFQADDADSPEYSIVNYRFAPLTDADTLATFNINQHTGQLFLTKYLDYEHKVSYSFDVIAFDKQHDQEQSRHNVNDPPLGSGQLYTSTAAVVIVVEDINDEAPVISIDYLAFDYAQCRPSPCASLFEGSNPPQFVANILVTDKDTDTANNNINCELVHEQQLSLNYSDWFHLSEIRRQTGRVEYNLLTSKIIDREEMWSIKQLGIKVLCTDSGKPILKSMTAVQARIIDVNDNIPEISVKYIQPKDFDASSSNEFLYLMENTPIGTVLVQLNVMDRDEGNNGRVVCSIKSDSHIGHGDVLNYFALNPHTCQLTLKKAIDRESLSLPLRNITLKLAAQDLGSPALSSTVDISISLLDVNDNQPKLDQSFYEFRVRENAPNGTCVGTFLTSDLDGDQFPLSMRFQRHHSLPFVLWKPLNIKAGNPIHQSTQHQFYLNTTQVLDRETREIYEFNVFLIDNDELNMGQKFTATASVRIIVEDVNDNDPSIIFPQKGNKTFTISNSERRQYQLMTINAKDRDSVDSHLTFELLYKGLVQIKNRGKITDKPVENASASPTIQSTFLRIDSASGTIYVDRDMVANDTGLHAFTVRVSDSHQPPRSTELDFLVNVADIPARYSSYINSDKRLDHASHKIDSSTSIVGAIDNQIGRQNDKQASDRTTYERKGGGARVFLNHLTGDAILILSLGLILLLLLVTLCLVIHVRGWNFTSRQTRGDDRRPLRDKPFMALFSRKNRQPSTVDSHDSVRKVENANNTNSLSSRSLGLGLEQDRSYEAVTLSRKSQPDSGPAQPLIHFGANNAPPPARSGDYTALCRIGDIDQLHHNLIYSLSPPSHHGHHQQNVNVPDIGQTIDSAQLRRSPYSPLINSTVKCSTLAYNDQAESQPCDGMKILTTTSTACYVPPVSLTKKPQIYPSCDESRRPIV